MDCHFLLQDVLKSTGENTGVPKIRIWTRLSLSVPGRPVLPPAALPVLGLGALGPREPGPPSQRRLLSGPPPVGLSGRTGASCAGLWAGSAAQTQSGGHERTCGALGQLPEGKSLVFTVLYDPAGPRPALSTESPSPFRVARAATDANLRGPCSGHQSVPFPLFVFSPHLFPVTVVTKERRKASTQGKHCKNAKRLLPQNPP